MNRRNKVGGILDRRIGENDPTMSVEDKMIERYTRENQRRKGASVFDLEEAEDEEELTHGGRALDLGVREREIEDYDAASVEASSDGEGQDVQSRKRRRDPAEEGEEEDGEVDVGKPERKKTKAEVMKEVMAKSKLHKYERQQAKEDDDDLREELDKDLPNILAALRGHLNKPQPKEEPPKANDFAINPDRAALLNGKEREVADKEYDARVRQLLYDQKAKPTERIKTEEEKAEEEATRLKNLEEQRLRRMRGEPVEDEAPFVEGSMEDEEEEYESGDDAAEFGFSAAQNTSRPDGVDDEDDFVLDDDLVASDSEFDEESSNDSDDEENVADETQDLDDEFLKEVLPTGNGHISSAPGTGAQTSKLTFTYPCPQSQAELLRILEGVAPSEIPVVIQRIRALYHPQLHHENKAKLANFAIVLVDYTVYLSSQTTAPSLVLLETIIRHIHSLSRIFPEQIARAFRTHLQRLHTSNDPSPGDLIILTAISTIYPTSDHFHQVVTPAITLMARWLGMSTPRDSKDLTTGAYIGALCLQHQRLSKRYIPELMRYTTIALKSPFATSDLIDLHIKNLTAAADLWASKSAFLEIFPPELLTLVKDLKQPKALQRLQILLQQSRLARRPLELHHHRPLPIKTSVPKFEEGFNPDRHYDPDTDRATANKLQAEYKKERKGAMRELRKDANFIAREQLREKKERDRAYETKYKRLVAEIQGEEGKEKNAYERERRARKGKGG
ncbi:Nop14-like protein, partial [Mytilinidion resinicola]